jgi:hypothetical protein
MRALATQGPGHYRCANCRSRVHVDIPAMDMNPARCPLTDEVGRCPSLRMPGFPVCPRHLDYIIGDAINDLDIRSDIARQLGEREVGEQIQAAQARHEREEQARAERVRAMRPDCPVVYYVRLAEDVIKIGTTVYLPQRMAGLRIISRDQVLAAEPGDQKLEKKRHRQFAHLRYHHLREDFQPAEDLLKHITAVRAEHGPPYELVEQMLAKARHEAQARLLATHSHHQ